MKEYCLWYNRPAENWNEALPLGNGNECLNNIEALLRKSILPNLFDNHPPFQIDGNLGLVSGIAEMLIQSHTGRTVCLPALPDAWKNDSVSGLHTRDGQTVNLKWRDGKLISLTDGQTVNLKWRDGKLISLTDGA